MMLMMIFMLELGGILFCILLLQLSCTLLYIMNYWRGKCHLFQLNLEVFAKSNGEPADNLSDTKISNSFLYIHQIRFSISKEMFLI